jgi:hypothetical protein
LHTFLINHSEEGGQFSVLSDAVRRPLIDSFRLWDRSRRRSVTKVKRIVTISPSDR